MGRSFVVRYGIGMVSWVLYIRVQSVQYSMYIVFSVTPVTTFEVFHIR